MKSTTNSTDWLNTLKREEKETCNTDRYLWWDDSNARKHMTDRDLGQVHIPQRLLSNQIGKTKAEGYYL